MSESSAPSPGITSPPVDDSNTLLSVSTIFHPGTEETDDSDLVLASSDGVYFFVHRRRLLEGSSNSFGGLLPPTPEDEESCDTVFSPPSDDPLEEDTSIHDPTIDLQFLGNLEFLATSDPIDKPVDIILFPESSSLLNIILHIIYGYTMEKFQPELQLLCFVLSALVRFGYRPAELITPHSEIFHLLVAHSKVHPLPVYALAASHKIDCLAVSCSKNTLGIELSELTDELASIMGAVYAKRLFFLHLGRTEALRRLLLEPPAGHPLSDTCDVNKQKSLIRAWAFAIAYMTLEARPDTQPATLGSILSASGEQSECASCLKNLSTRVQQVVQDWSAVRDTI